nr:hypothetical protein [Leptospira noguchii]
MFATTGGLNFSFWPCERFGTVGTEGGLINFPGFRLDSYDLKILQIDRSQNRSTKL